jgi:YesN/AraC family two-component response regulator
VLTDIEMPTLGGRGMVDELHEMSPEIRVLFMSGYTDNEILRRGIRTSETDFLQKPFTAESLCAAVRSVLAKPATPAL